jgi:putative membrane protein
MRLIAALCLLAPAAAWAHSASAGAGQSSAPLWLTAALFASAWWCYPFGAMRARPRPLQRLCFHTGMLTIGAALFGPFDEWAAGSTAMHMVQHMLLIALAAPLLVWARPLAQWRAALGPHLDLLTHPLLRSTRHPWWWACVHAAVLWGWHAPVPYMAAIQNNWLHALEHACFLLSAWAFWWSVLHASPTRRSAALLAIAFTLMHTGFLGALLTFAAMPLYFSESRSLADQQLAGLLMWVPGSIVYLAAAAWCASRWTLDRQQFTRNAAPHSTRSTT